MAEHEYRTTREVCGRAASLDLFSRPCLWLGKGRSFIHLVGQTRDCMKGFMCMKAAFGVSRVCVCVCVYVSAVREGGAVPCRAVYKGRRVPTCGSIRSGVTD